MIYGDIPFQSKNELVEFHLNLLPTVSQGMHRKNNIAHFDLSS